MQKQIRIPQSMHEVFGEETNLLDLVLTLFFGLAATFASYVSSKTQLEALPLWSLILLLLISADIFSGFLANLTYSTNAYYQKNPQARLIFIAIHVQPLIIAFLAGNYFVICAAIWAYSVISALLVNHLNGHSSQRIVGALLLGGGLTCLTLYSQSIPSWVLFVLSFYMLKLIFSFPIDHFAQGRQ